MDVAKKTEIINQRLEAHYGIPGRKAAHADPLRSLVLTILSQNTTDVNAARAFDAMEARFSGADGRVEWAKVAQAPVDELACGHPVGGVVPAEKRANSEYFNVDQGDLRRLSA